MDGAGLGVVDVSAIPSTGTCLRATDEKDSEGLALRSVAISCLSVGLPFPLG